MAETNAAAVSPLEVTSIDRLQISSPHKQLARSFSVCVGSLSWGACTDTPEP
jgi:hypothetical protein